MAQGQDTERKLSFDQTTYQVKCLNCGRTFTAQRSDATYCTARCRKQANRAAHSYEDAVRELTAMAWRVERFSKTFADNQAVRDEVRRLAASIQQSSDNFFVP